jgi:predicted transcriptional regulator
MELLVALRELGMSQKAFAALAGIRQEAVSRYVRGHVPVPRLVEMAVASLKNTEAAQ